MLNRFALFTTVSLALVLPACAAVTDEDTAGSSDALSTVPNQTAWAEGSNWSYHEEFLGLPRTWVYRPKGFSKKAPGQRGVIFHLLGCGEVPYQLAQGGGWPEAAEAHGMVIVIPDMIAPSHPNAQAANVACYNFGAGLASEPTRNSPDHKALIAAGQKVLQDPALKVDPRQVYLTGFSAGATVAMQVACMAPDIFAGVGSVAGPSIGTDQSRAVMPPQLSADQVRSKCTNYAGTAGRDKLATQLYAIVSDNNGLPAGNPIMVDGVWTADKFQKQTIWDGDKYVPFAHHNLITGAMSTVFGARKTGTNIGLDGAGAPFSGQGIGCPGGEASQGDSGETECNFGQATQRSWNVKADVWTDAQGRKRIVHVKQDTVRHRWPAGPATHAFDVPITPGRQQLIDEGYIDPATGIFDVRKVNAAPNGMLGGLYFGRDTFDFPMFFVDFLANNNPRLPATPPTDLGIQAAAAVSASNATISGSVTAPGKAKVTSVVVAFRNANNSVAIPSGESTVSFSVDLDTRGLAAGEYEATVRAEDSAGHTASSVVGFRVGGNDGRCFTSKNSQHVSAGRAHYATGFLKALANGSNDDLGYAYLANDQSSSVKEQSANHWVKVASCP